MSFMSVDMSPFLGWLLKTTVQGSVLIVLIIAIKWSLRAKLTARWQSALWLLLLVRLGAPWMPQSRLSLSGLIFKSAPPSHATTVTAKHVSHNGIPGSTALTAESKQENGIGLAEEQPPTEASAHTEPATAPARPVASEQPPNIEAVQETIRAHLFTIWPWLWLTGALGLGVYIGLRSLRLWLIVTAERQLVDQEVLQLLEDCKLHMQVKTPISVVVTDRLRSPALFGFVRPRILLPQGLLEMLSLDELQYVFMHELAHLKRGDIYLRWLTAILQILHWFNPLIWFGFRRLHADQESACDALAMSRMASEETPLYGHTLVRLLERFSQPQYLPSVAGILEDRSRLERRISMISQFKNASYRWSPMAAALIIGLACIVLPDAPQLTQAGTSPEAQAQPQVTLRLLKERNINERSAFWSLSPDGLKMVYTTPRAPRITVRDLSTGVERKYEQGAYDRHPPVWSPDSKRIAFWATYPEPVSILTLDTGDVEKTDIQGLPCDWSRDGRFLLVIDERDHAKLELQLVDLKTGKTQVVNTRDFEYPGVAWGWAFPGNPRLSPDGRHVVYHAREDDEEYDIYVQPIDSDERIRITSHRRSDWNPLWSPDGKHILFLSDRAVGGRDLLSIAFQNGKPMGTPKTIMQDVGDSVTLYSCSNSGRLLFVENDIRCSISSTKVDPVSGKIMGEPDQLTDGKPYSAYPKWSQNGKSIAYILDTGAGRFLCVMNADGRDKRTLCPVAFADNHIKWHPDNEHVLYSGYGIETNYPAKRPGLGGIYSVSIRSREHKLIYHDPNSFATLFEDISPDGKYLALPGGIWISGGWSQLHISDYNGQNRRQLAESEGGIQASIFTPDGKEIIYHSIVTEEGRTPRQSIMAVPFEGGEPREIYATKDPKEHLDMGYSTWLPDGRLVFDIRPASGGRLHCAINLDGQSEPAKLSPGKMGNGFNISPDGTRAVFCRAKRTSKTWLMSDFLPNSELVEDASGDPSTPPTSESKTHPGTAGPQADSGLTLRKLSDIPSGFSLARARSISRDGRHLLGPEGILDLMTGEIRKVENFDRSQFTPDGSRIVGSVGSPRLPRKEESTRSVAVFDLRSGETMEIYRSEHLSDVGRYMDCSPNGQNILAKFWKKDKSRDLVSISIADGAVRVLKSFAASPNARGHRHLLRDYRFSPDGLWVAYGIWSEAGPSNRGQGDVFLIAADGSTESPLVQHPANDELLGWAPFGDQILFASDRRGTWDIYMIQVVDGKPVGEAVLVKAAVSAGASVHVDRRTGVGFTDSGAFYYLSESDTTDVYVAALDPTTGRITGNPIKATNIESMNSSPAWSRDSRFLAWTTGRGNLRIRDMETGKIQKLATNAGQVDSPQWSLDGRSIFALKGAGMQAVRIDRESGTASIIMEGDGKGWWRNHPVWQWSPDGKSFYRQKSMKMLTRRDIGTGDEWEISLPVDWAFPVLSPDCEQFVFGDVVPNSEMTVFSRTINIRPTNGGAVRKLVKFSELSGAEVRSFLSDSGLGWTPDGRYVLFVKGKSDNSKVRSLWRVPATGGEPEALGLEMESLRQPAISPDGRYIAFTTGGSKVELWSMENFLPSVDVVAK
jgi:bla regulator protein blaR1